MCSWRGTRPDGTETGRNITLAGRVAGTTDLWLFLKEKFLSHRLLDDYDAIEAAVCTAWKRIIGEAGRLTSLTSYPWIMNCVSS